MARPTKATEETFKRIADALTLGSTYEHAAAAGGITFETFNQWRKTNPEFSDLVKRAESKAALTWLNLIEEAAKSGNWQAAAWKLERRYPESFGRRQRLEAASELTIEIYHRYPPPLDDVPVIEVETAHSQP